MPGRLAAAEQTGHRAQRRHQSLPVGRAERRDPAGDLGPGARVERVEGGAARLRQADRPPPPVLAAAARDPAARLEAPRMRLT